MNARNRAEALGVLREREMTLYRKKYVIRMITYICISYEYASVSPVQRNVQGSLSQFEHQS